MEIREKDGLETWGKTAMFKNFQGNIFFIMTRQLSDMSPNVTVWWFFLKEQINQEKTVHR